MEQKEQKQTESSQDKVFIKDLGLEVDSNLVKDDSGTPEQKEKQTEAPEDGKPSENSSQSGELPEDFTNRFKNKTPQELMKVVYDSQKQIGELGRKLGENKKGSSDEYEELTEQKHSVEKSLEKMKTRLTDEFDDDVDKDDEAYNKLQKDIKKKESRLQELKDKVSEAKIGKSIQSQMDKIYNDKFLKEARNAFTEDLGMENIEDEIWENISANAKKFAGTGEQLTKEDIEAGAVKTFGADNYRKLLTSMSKQKVREEISTASQKKTGELTGKASSEVSLSEMNPHQIEKLLDYYWENDSETYQKLSAQIKKLPLS